MLIEELEDRRLFSSSLFVFLATHPRVTAHLRALSQGQIVTELATMVLGLSPTVTPQARPGARPAATAAARETLTIAFQTPTDPFVLAFNPSTLEPFGSVYTVKLSSKPSLSLFNITQKIGKEKLHFTGKFNSKVTAFGGVLQVTGPTNQVSFTYTAS
jgi:hypothetical protein